MHPSLVKVHWDQSLSTGHKATDLQHQILFDIINDLVASVEHNEGEEHFISILDRLQHYAKWHFEREENYMTAYRCVASEVNKMAHAGFVRKITGFREKSNDGVTIELVIQLYNELSKWLKNHILKVDCQLLEHKGEFDIANKV